MGEGEIATSQSNQSASDKVSLREYFEQMIRHLEKATSLAASNMEKRLEGMNEFRAQLKDQVATFVTKTEFDAEVNRIQIEIQLMRDNRMSYMPRAEADALISRIENDIKLLQISKATLEGKASQAALMFVTVATIISGAIGIISLIMSLGR